MKKLPSTFTNMALALTGITMVTIGLLSLVNDLTREPIARANLKALTEAVGAVIPEFENDPIQDQKVLETGESTFLIYPGYKDGELTGAAVQSRSLGFGGELTVLVGFDAEGRIVDYSILSHSETPGLGAKAAQWFKKGGKGDITGLIPSQPLSVSKDGGTVDAITASTITSRAFLRAVNAAYQAFMGQATDGQTSATPQTSEHQRKAPDGQTSATPMTDEQKTPQNSGHTDRRKARQDRQK